MRESHGIERPCAAAMRKQHQEPAGDRQILFEMQELVAVTEFGVKQSGGGDTKSGEEEGGGTRVIAAEDQKPAAQLDRWPAVATARGRRMPACRRVPPNSPQACSTPRAGISPRAGGGQQARPPPSAVMASQEPSINLGRGNCVLEIGQFLAAPWTQLLQ